MKEVIIGIPIQWYIYLSVILFCIGVMGVLFRRNAIIIFMCVELMLNAVNLLMVAFSRYFGDTGAQVFVFFVMVVAAAEVERRVVPGGIKQRVPVARLRRVVPQRAHRVVIDRERQAHGPLQVGIVHALQAVPLGH